MCGPTRPADLHPHLGRALKALRRQVAELHKDNEFLGKAAAFFASLANDRRTVRTDDRGEGELTRLTRMARLLGVSRSGFYAWVKRQAAEPGTQRRARDELDVKVCKVLAEPDDASQELPESTPSSPVRGPSLTGRSSSRNRCCPRAWRASVRRRSSPR